VSGARHAGLDLLARMSAFDAFAVAVCDVDVELLPCDRDGRGECYDAVRALSYALDAPRRMERKVKFSVR
jgi:hypothetical protein